MDRNDLTREMRWYIADQLAKDKLDIVNQNSQLVVPNRNIYSRFVKRFIDILVSLIILLVTLPINLILAIFTFFDVGHPIFFVQERTGRNGKIFHIIKLRNMNNNKDEHGNLLPPSQRVTKFGKIMRKTSLDELLNFWSILKGDMSLIGPRPLVPEYEKRYSDRHHQRLLVRPGLECPPRKGLDHVWTWQEQFENDVWYVENISFKTDCKMFFYLIKYTFNRKNTKSRSLSKRGSFMGYNDDLHAVSISELPQEYIDLCKDWKQD